MMMKKLVIASAVALMGMGSAYAQSTPLEDELGTLLSSIITPGTAGPELGVLSGSINTGALLGNIDISGTNVGLSSMATDVSAKAEAIGTNSTASAYAIAGAKLGTTVIGSMNSATVDVMAKVTEQTEATTSSLGIGSLAVQGGEPTVTTQSFGDGTLGLATTGSDILAITTASQSNLGDLTSSTSTDAMNKVHELQNMNVFNAAINVADLDASIVITATVDPNAWFLNPQTGVVNLSNIEMSTTNIGAMNSSLTRLGVKF